MTKGSLLPFAHSAGNVAHILGVWAVIRVLAWTFGLDSLSWWDYLLLGIVFVGQVVAVGVFLVANRVPEPKIDPGEMTADLGVRGGYVYLVKGPKGYFKIGRTRNPADRYQTFKLNLPFEVSYEHLIPCEDQYEAEAWLQRCFAHRRVIGTEWFQLSKDEVRLIKSLERVL